MTQPQTDSNTSQEFNNLLKAHQVFINHLKSNNRSTSTILAYGKDIEQLVEYVFEQYNVKHVHLVNGNHLNEFKKHLSQKNYTAKSISRKINSIKSFFRHLKNIGQIKNNPADNIKHPKYENKTPRILSKTEYRALRDSCKNDFRTFAVVETLLQTGLRISELANLKIKNIKLNHLLIEPYESQPGREVPLNKAAQSAINQWLKIRPSNSKTNHLFITKNGRQLLIRNIRTSIDRYFKLAEIQNCTVNDLRHTWITHHLANGASLVTISKIAGHKRLSTTSKYLQLIKDKIQITKIQLEEL